MPAEPFQQQPDPSTCEHDRLDIAYQPYQFFGRTTCGTIYPFFGRALSSGFRPSAAGTTQGKAQISANHF